MVNGRARLDEFLRHRERYGYCESGDVPAISDLFDAADQSRFNI